MAEREGPLKCHSLGTKTCLNAGLWKVYLKPQANKGQKTLVVEDK